MFAVIIVNHSPALTPTLPGYISVWSCDQQTAEVMLRNVKRSPSLTQTDEKLNNDFIPMQKYNIHVV